MSIGYNARYLYQAATSPLQDDSSVSSSASLRCREAFGMAVEYGAGEHVFLLDTTFRCSWTAPLD